MTACASKDDQVTKISTLAAAAATLFLAAACSSTPGTPSPAPSNAGSVPSGTAPTSSDTAPGVPKVSAPLNAAKYEQDPCSLLTKEQAGQFIGGLRTSSKDSNSPACTWNGENGDSIGVTFIPNQGGLATIYKNGRNGGSAYFEPAEVAGYPAAYVDVSDDRKTIGCQISVGITDGEVFAVSNNLQTSSPLYGKPCPAVLKAAELVVAKLKDGA